MKLAPGETVTIDTTFRLEPAILSDRPNAAAPFVDRFGQSIHANWPEKLRSEADLKGAMQSEERRLTEMGVAPGFDRYGGSTTLGCREPATGFFRTVQRDGFWWLVTPEGNPGFYMAVDTVTGFFESTQIKGREQFFDNLPARDGVMAGAWSDNNQKLSFTRANLIRKYGENWENDAWQSAERRLRTWGFAGVGKWSGINSPQNGPMQMPSQPVVRRTGVPTIGRMPDVFDPDVRATFRATLEKTIAPNRDNPYVLGWSVGNEHEEVVLRSDIATMLKRDASVPVKRALVAFGVKNIYGGDAAKMAAAWKVAPGANALAALEAATSPAVPAADIETLRRYFADEYYGYIYRTIKDIDPNHLVFSFWMIAGWWEDEEDWHIMARNCDVIGYDSYSYPFGDARLMNLLKKVGQTRDVRRVFVSRVVWRTARPGRLRRLSARRRHRRRVLRQLGARRRAQSLCDRRRVVSIPRPAAHRTQCDRKSGADQRRTLRVWSGRHHRPAQLGFGRADANRQPGRRGYTRSSGSKNQW